MVVEWLSGIRIYKSLILENEDQEGPKNNLLSWPWTPVESAETHGLC